MDDFSSFWTTLERQNPRNPRIAFTDPFDPRILKAARILIDKKIAHPVLIAEEAAVQQKTHAQGLSPFGKENFLPPSSSTEDPLQAGVVYLNEGKVDGLVGGSLRPTADIVKAALKMVKTKPGVRLVGGHFFIESTERRTADGGPFLFADCAVMPEPSSNALAAIAVEAARSYRFFTKKEPLVAFLSFSTKGSAEHPLVDRIRQAVVAAKKLDPSITMDGEIQADAALDRAVAEIKGAGDSPVAGQANVLIFPTLEAGNAGYKLIQRFSKTRIAGPLLWGLNKPMSDLSRGCTIQEVVDTAALVAAMIPT